jgi:acyl-coenzyme A thioesterase PaaI-like protein
MLALDGLNPGRARSRTGSVYFKALDDAAFFAVNSLVPDVFVLTASFNIYLTRPVSDGDLRCVGRVVHRSKTQYLAEAELFNDAGKSIGRGNGAFVRSTINLSAEVGYA